jgi:hypothetical protein
MRIARQQGGGGHDLAGLAIAALDHLAVQPGLLDGLAAGRLADGLDGGHGGLTDAVDGGDAGARRLTVDMHRAGPAERHAAAEFRTRHAEHIAQHPEQRRIAVDIDGMNAPDDLYGIRHGPLPCCGERIWVWVPYAISADNPKTL